MRAVMASVACALATVAAAQAGAPPRGEAPFVVAYRCDGGRHVVVGYPAYRDAHKTPIRLDWQGRTILLMPARAGSGARYINAIADLEWWSKGDGGSLTSLRDNQPLLTRCTEF